MTFENIASQVVATIISALILGIVGVSIRWLARRKLSPSLLQRIVRFLDRNLTLLLFTALFALMLFFLSSILQSSLGIALVLLGSIYTALAAMGVYTDAKRNVMAGKTVVNVRVLADQEGGVPTGIYIRNGEAIQITARGRVSIDNGQTWRDPSGHIISFGDQLPPTPGLFTLVSNTLLPGTARVGQLVGWIEPTTKQDKLKATTFEVGSQFETTAPYSGELYLAVNDVKGSFDDNTNDQGEPTFFMAKVRVTRSI